MEKDKKVTITAKLQKKTFTGWSGIEHLVFEDVYVDGELYRDHIWLNYAKRFRAAKMKIGKVYSFTALVLHYPDVENVNGSKVGFGHIRNIKLLEI